MKKRARLLTLLLVAVLAGGGLWYWWARSTADDGTSATVATVTRGTVSETVLASGQIEAKQLVSVGARVSGQIETLAVSLGDTVKAGDLIAQIDSQDQQNDVLQAEADLANIEAQIVAMQANLRKAELTLERQTALGKSDWASKETIESATAEVQVYTANLAALQAQKARAEVTVTTAKIELDRTRITAPISGTVVAVAVEQGQTVNAIQSAPTLVKLADLDTMQVKAEISEADVVHVKPGQDVRFTILGEPETTFTAKVSSIEPAPSEIESSDTISTDEAIYYNGLLDVANPEHKLRIGMTTQVSVLLDKAENVLTVPAAAVKRDDAGTYVEVWDAKTGTATPTRVEVGLNDKVTAEIRAGLSAGQQVVTGTAVAPKAAGSSTTRMRSPMGM